MYSDTLAENGFSVLEATDGLEALQVLRTETPDLILLDLVMPNLGGLEVLEQVKNDGRLASIPVLILSNRGEDEDMERSVELGAADFLIKNEVRPADVAHRIMLMLKDVETAAKGPTVYRVMLKDGEGDADQLVQDASLTRRFWCPACQVELALELVPNPREAGHYDAHFICPSCAREF
jgi:CheY-like chemotaxis protein